MPRDFAFTLQYESPVERVYAALVDVERWRRRVAGAANVDLVFGAAEPGAFEVTVTERGAVPAPLRRVVKGEFGLTRTDRWGPVESGTARQVPAVHQQIGGELPQILLGGHVAEGQVHELVELDGEYAALWRAWTS